MPHHRHVAFYRDLNLGQRGSPDRTQLEQALLGAGATTATSFQANGTVVLTAEAPHQVVDAAAATLARRHGSRIGSPNRVIEERCGVPATTRSMRTVERLARRFRRPA